MTNNSTTLTHEMRELYAKIDSAMVKLEVANNELTLATREANRLKLDSEFGQK